MSRVAAAVFHVLGEELGIPEAHSEHTLEDLCVDSLDRQELAQRLEVRLGCTIPPGIADQWTTVQSVIDSLTLLAGAVGKANEL